ncbi:MAG: hypothetical protein HYR96_10825 [Deltaproteobacteria bacterium]|nr:hypothetical protein [Deltaproteobacteria bacterium]MBI3293617.1 hypothetical protein [Deltaproteobacteria bacterium]
MLKTLIVLLMPVAVFGDLIIHSADGTNALVYRSGSEVVYEKCSPKSQLARGCSGTPRPYSVPAAEYVVRINSFYGITDRNQAAPGGLERVTLKIGQLDQVMNGEGVSHQELKNAQAVQEQLKLVQAKYLAADRAILRFLDKEASSDIFSEVHSSKKNIVEYAFFPTAFIEGQVYRLSQASHLTDRAASCFDMGADWTPVEDALAEDQKAAGRLKQSSLLRTNETVALWTNSVRKAGQYKMSCHFSYPCKGHSKREEFFSIENYHAREASNARFGFTLCYGTAGGIWYDCKDRISRQQIDYLPASVGAVLLNRENAKAYDQSLEAGENSPVAVSLRTLCRKEFKPEID